MTSFTGFPPGKQRFTRLPGVFFTDLLPHIDHLGELKITLYLLWRLERMEGTFRCLRIKHFTSDEDFMAGLGKNAVRELKDGLSRAVERGTLLVAEADLGDGPEPVYFLNTLRGQAAVEAIRSGNWQPTQDPDYPIKLNLEKPNLFRLYEQHFGPLTPMIADALKETEKNYPPEWIEEAIRLSVENNVRKWRYAEAILERWKQEGRHARTDRRDSEKDRKKYVQGEYADFIEY
ncbi:MAG: DnaD domain protein [Anaerolineales bacterium]|jgi:DnaD/phage-associated family protein